MHKVVVNRLGGLSLPKKSVVRLTDYLDMTSAVYHRCKITTQQHLEACLVMQNSEAEGENFLYTGMYL